MSWRTTKPDAKPRYRDATEATGPSVQTKLASKIVRQKVL
jgi:hypothetical protein